MGTEDRAKFDPQNVGIKSHAFRNTSRKYYWCCRHFNISALCEKACVDEK